MMYALPPPPVCSRPSRRLLVLTGLAALIAVAISLWPDDSPPDGVVDPSTTRPRNTGNAGHPVVSTREPLAQPRLVRVAAVDLFAGHSWYVPPPPPPARAPEAPLPPAAPPFPFSYLGQYEHPGEKPVYFLQRGDSVFDVRVGQVLDGVWNVDSVADGRMRLTYTPLKLTQDFSLGSTP